MTICRSLNSNIGADIAVTGDIETKPWDLPDIRGTITEGELPEHVEATLDSQRYEPEHQAVSLYLQRFRLI